MSSLITCFVVDRRLNSQAARPLALSQAIARIESEEGIEAKKERLTLATIRSVNKKRYVQHIEKWGEGIPAAAPAGFAGNDMCVSISHCFAYPVCHGCGILLLGFRVPLLCNV
jgi:hypothetical protein